MNGMTGALIGALLAGGVLLIVAGMRATAAPREAGTTVEWQPTAIVIGGALLAAIVVWALTGWPARFNASNRW